MFRIVLVACLAAIAVNATSVRHCDSIPAPAEVRIEGCDKPPCKLKRGFNAKMEIDFTAAADYDVLEAEVVATALGMETNFPLPEPNACNGLTQGSCPIRAGDLITYLLELPVYRIYPKIPLTIQFTLRGPAGEAITCFSVACKVV